MERTHTIHHTQVLYGRAYSLSQWSGERFHTQPRFIHYTSWDINKWSFKWSQQDKLCKELGKQSEVIGKMCPCHGREGDLGTTHCEVREREERIKTDTLYCTVVYFYTAQGECESSQAAEWKVNGVKESRKNNWYEISAWNWRTGPSSGLWRPSGLCVSIEQSTFSI